MENSRHIVVTGCAGFIGSHLSERLLDLGHKVIGIDNFDPFYDRKIKESNLTGLLDHPNFTFHEFDLADSVGYEAIAGEKVDVVIHLAARPGVGPSVANPLSYLQANLLATNVLLEWMRERDIRKFLFASSSSVYGNNTKVPFNEDDAVIGPISPYAYTKRAAELMNYTYHHLYGMDVLNLRFFTVYGPRQRPDLAIHKFVHLVEHGQNIEMYGDGTSARDYTFVSDTVSGIVGALKYIQEHNNVYEIINLGNNAPVKLSTLIQVIGSALQTTPKVQTKGMQQGDVNITFADIAKAQKLLGYNPGLTIEEGVKQFVDWYRGQENAAQSN